MTPLRLRRNRAFASTCVALVTGMMLGGCAGLMPRESASAFEAPDALFSVQPGRGFRQLPPGTTPFDMAFKGPGGLTLAIITSRPPLPLDEVDRRIAERIAARAENGRIIDVRDTMLGGLPARASSAYSTLNGVPIHTVNLHTSTKNETVEVVAWVPATRAHMLRSLVRRLENGAFHFLRSAVGFDATPPDFHALPVLFDPVPQGWTPLAKGELNPAAAIELSDGAGLFLIGIIEETKHVPYDAMQASVEQRLAMLLGRGQDPEPHRAFARDGTAPDVLWSQRGLLDNESPVDVVYRVRLVEMSGQFLHMYCWGDAERDDLQERCDATLKAAHLP